MKIQTNEIARITAKILLDIKAVNFNVDTPFTLTSGKKSPTYVDCRKLIAFPRARSVLMDFAVTKIINDMGIEAFDGIAGGETAGIPFAAWIADRLQLPMHYVRKKPKGFGKNARIEGNLKKEDRILLVEDLATDGGSKISFIEALREAEGRVAHVFVIFHYGIFPQSITLLEQAGVQLHALATWHDILNVAREEKTFSVETLDEVACFLKDPEGWKAPQSKE